MLWRLTGRLADVDANLQRALDVARHQQECFLGCPKKLSCLSCLALSQL